MQSLTSQDVSLPGPSFRISASTWCHRTLYVTSSYSTWIFCRGVSGFATDGPCDVWCRGLTTCLLHVGPSFGNRFWNTSWAVGLTYWIVYHNIFVFWHMQLYMSWYMISFFASTRVLTSSIDVVFVLSIKYHKIIYQVFQQVVLVVPGEVDRPLTTCLLSVGLG